VFPEADAAEAEIIHLIDTNKMNIIFDFSSCEFIASSGYAMFIRIKKECEEQGLHFAFANCNDTVKKGFFVIGYQNIIKFFDNAADAKSYLS
jgi:anti-anti-sigma factor